MTRPLPRGSLVAPLTELIKKQPLALEAYLLLQRTSKSPTAWTQLLDEHTGQLPPGFAELVLAYGRKHAGDDIGRGRSVGRHRSPPVVDRQTARTGALDRVPPSAGAMTAFQQLNAAFPNNVEILLPWAECAMQAGRWTAARNIYEQVQPGAAHDAPGAPRSHRRVRAPLARVGAPGPADRPVHCARHGPLRGRAPLPVRLCDRATVRHVAPPCQRPHAARH